MYLRIRITYEIITNPKYFSELKRQTHLSEAYVNAIVRKVRRKILKDSLNYEWVRNSNVPQKTFLEAYTHFLKYLKDKQIFRVKIRPVIQEAVLLVFALITGKLEISTFEGKKQMEVIQDLMQIYGFKYYPQQKNSFGYILTMFLSKLIYDAIKRVQFKLKDENIKQLTKEIRIFIETRCF